MRNKDYQEKMNRHGECLNVPIDNSVSEFVKVSEGKELIIGHSETGHHHVVCGDVVGFEELTSGKLFEQICKKISGSTNREDWPKSLLPFQVRSTSVLKHLKTHDQHNSEQMEPGVYVKVGKTEYDPFLKVIERVRD